MPEQPADLDGFLSQAKEFAASEYPVALFKGDSLPPDQKQVIAEKLHKFTGLSTEYLRRCHLKINKGRFFKELLRSRCQTLAEHDTRFLGKDPDDAGEAVEIDPFVLGISGPFVAIINDYLSAELGVKIEKPYKVASLDAARSWKRAGEGKGAFDGFLNTTDYLAKAAATNKDFRVFVAGGMHDLATPCFGAEYVFEHSGIAKDRRILKNYHGGHMMYLYPFSLQKLSEDFGGFMTFLLVRDGTQASPCADSRKGRFREQTAAKWIIDPYRSITINGWQTSNSTARRFFFTTENRSYAEWIGDTRNIGMISTAFFLKEKRDTEKVDGVRGRSRRAQMRMGPVAPSTLPHHD